MSPSPASPSISTTLERVGSTATPEEKLNPTSPFRHIRNRHAPLTSIREVAVSSHPLRTRPIQDINDLDQTTSPIRKGAALTRHSLYLEPIREVADAESAPAKKFHTRAFLSTLLRSLRAKMSTPFNRRTGSSRGV